MKKILFVLSMFQTAVLAAQVSPALSQLGALSPMKTSDIGPETPAVPAAPAAVENGRWAAVLALAVASGTYTDPNNIMPASKYLADIIGPMEGSHTADYFSAWGYGTATGPFNPDFVTFTSESWEINQDGNWVIDQWIHWMRTADTPFQVMHTTLIEKMSGQVLDWHQEAIEAGSPKAEEHRKALLERWYLYKLPGGTAAPAIPVLRLK
jgi:hypothetical protein